MGFTKNLPVDLTDEEVQARGETLAALFQRETELAIARKQAGKEHRELIKAVRTELVEVAKQVREKAQWKDVECREELDEARNLMAIVRMDTGAVVSTRPLLPDERQRKLALVPESLTEQVEQAKGKRRAKQTGSVLPLTQDGKDDSA